MPYKVRTDLFYFLVGKFMFAFWSEELYSEASLAFLIMFHQI